MSDFTISMAGGNFFIKCTDWRKGAPRGERVESIRFPTDGTAEMFMEATVTWPSIGSVPIDRAREFAADILKVCDMLEEEIRRGARAE